MNLSLTIYLKKMTHEFSHNPIILRIVDLQNANTKKSYVFVGQVPKEVTNELLKLEKNPNIKSEILRKFYGNDWRKSLGLVNLNKLDKKTGGNYDNLDDNLDDVFTTLNEQDNVDQVVNQNNVNGGDDFSIVVDAAVDTVVDDLNDVNNATTDAADDLNDVKSMLAINMLKSKEGNIYGSNEVSLEINDDLLNSLNELGDLSDINSSNNNLTLEDTLDTLDDNLIVKNNKLELIVPSDLQENAIDSIEITDLDINNNFLINQEETLNIKHTSGVKFIFDVPINPIDNFLEFKYKIYASIGIPIYRQHIWFKYQDRSYVVKYNILLHKQLEVIDITTLNKFYKVDNKIDNKIDNRVNFESIEGIPIITNYYNNKDFINVISYDSFDLLINTYNKYNTVEYYLVDLNDLINPNEIYNKIANDKYQIELIYYGFIIIYWPMITLSVFQDYLKNERSIKDIYPDLLPNKSTLLEQIHKESKITAVAYENYLNTKVEKVLLSSITSTIISINNYNQDVDVVISLRNLFDVLELTNIITYARANLLHNNQNVILRKSYLNEHEPKDIQPLNSLLIKIKTNSDTNENMRMIIFKNGNYIIKTDWREENYMDFNKITKVTSSKINPIVKMINNFSSVVKYHKIPMLEITSSNVSFTETSISFYYDGDTTEIAFNVFKNCLNDLVKSKIITSKENISNSLEFFFNKGMYKHDPTRIEKVINIDNYYEHLSNGLIQNKWDTLFNRTRYFQVINISSKLKIMINGLRDNIEMGIFIMFLKAIFVIYQNNIKGLTYSKINSQLTGKSKKSLKTLKVQDPLLYDFKKIYKSSVVYSKICQKPYQPEMLTSEEYNKLPSEKKKHALKYWNFTKQEPVWYNCPNSKFPYIKFIVKQHPKDFCIPCCKKMEMNENVNKKKQDIHKLCMSSYKYTGEKVNLIKGSHYIASYGKNIEPGRISRLPENTLEPLFFDTYSSNGSIDQECITSDGYYLFGVHQNLDTLENIGVCYALAHVLNNTVLEFLQNIIAKIKTNPDKFRILLDGNAGLYFSNVNSLIDNLLNLIEGNKLDENINLIPWNELFISIAYYYFGINTIIFEDSKKEVIDLILPKGLKTYLDMFPESHKNLVLLTRNYKYYPIYLINTEIFKRTGIIDNKLFHNESGIITIIKAVVKQSFENQLDKLKNNIDLVTFRTFCKENSIKIIHYYINYSNLCYAIVCKFNNVELYFPIESSHYPLEQDISLIFTSYNDKYNVEYATMLKLLNLFKKWNDSTSKKNGFDGINIYPNVSVEQWIQIRNSNKIIGFTHNLVNYFIKEMSISTALKYHNKPIQTLMYHPNYINNLIQKVKKGVIKPIIPDYLNEKYNQSIYDYYLHNLVIMHYINIFNKQHNHTMRKYIITTLSKVDFSKNINTVRNMLDEITDVEDSYKLKNIINRYVTIHHNKKQMFKDLENTYFNFDRIQLEKLRGLDLKTIKSTLLKYSEKFVKYGTPKIKDFPNMFVSCDSSNKLSYCSGNKLIIEKEKLLRIIDIIAVDMNNPSKWKWLFNSVFVERTIDYFKFIRRKSENITVEFVE
jgi:hypothetical protein